MSFTDEQIKNLLSKDIVSKTILVKPENVNDTIESYLKEGWKFENKVEMNGRYKITFTKVK